MNKVIIDKKFFELNNPSSEGLITGLKKISQRDFVIEVEGFNPDENIILFQILRLENIEINSASETNFEKTFFISDQKSENENAIIVSSNVEIKNFEQAVNRLIDKLRFSSQHRKTKETDIQVEVSLDGRGESKINSGIGFFDHMLEQIAKHANINLKVDVKGDLHIDEHHTVEDVGITLGTAVSEALGNKVGIKRYGFSLPMDDAIAHCAIDLGGRGFLNFKCKFEREKVGEFPTELTEEFFRGVASGLKANIFIRAKAKNDHHKIESIFKAFAKSLNEACRMDERNEGNLPSTKGML